MNLNDVSVKTCHEADIENQMEELHTDLQHHAEQLESRGIHDLADQTHQLSDRLREVHALVLSRLIPSDAGRDPFIDRWWS